MDRRAQQPEDFIGAFESAFARLQVVLETACSEQAPWPDRASAAIRDALEFAAAEPQAASVLTAEALTQGVDGVERYERLMSYVAGLLEPGREESPQGGALPESIERSLAGGIATIVANRIERGEAPELPELVSDVVQFVLTPYLGIDEARRLAAWDGGPGERPGR